MTVDVRGRVVTGRNQQPIYGALVEISLAGNQTSLKPTRVITNRSGSFWFRIKDNELGTAQDIPRADFRVLDERGNEIGKLGVALTRANASALKIRIGKGDLQRAALPPQPGDLTLISEDVFETIRSATSKASTPQTVQTYS